MASNDADFFTIGSDLYLAIAEIGEAVVFRFDPAENEFSLFQTLPSFAALSIGVTAFEIDGIVSPFALTVLFFQVLRIRL